MDSGKVLIGVMAGAAIGVLFGILYAPDKGSETRHKISKGSTDALDELKSNFDELLHNLNEKMKAAKEEAVTLYEKGKKGVQDGVAEVKHGLGQHS
jgi:gas vesicle protein